MGPIASGRGRLTLGPIAFGGTLTLRPARIHSYICEVDLFRSGLGYVWVVKSSFVLVLRWYI